MHFTIRHKRGNLVLNELLLRQGALCVVASYGVPLSDMRLNGHLLKKYSMNLTQACIFCLKHSKYYKNYNNEMIVMFNSPLAEKLVTLITYGDPTIGISGSKILVKALERI